MTADADDDDRGALSVGVDVMIAVQTHAPPILHFMSRARRRRRHASHRIASHRIASHGVGDRTERSARVSI